MVGMINGCARGRSTSPQYLWQQTLRTHVDKFNNLHIITIPMKAAVCAVPIPEQSSVCLLPNFLTSFFEGTGKGSMFQEALRKVGGDKAHLGVCFMTVM